MKNRRSRCKKIENKSPITVAVTIDVTGLRKEQIGYIKIINQKQLNAPINKPCSTRQ
jgi:hypothetical protein